MTTLRQIAANRANGAKSNGPVTSEGKEVSRRNAMTHGFCATTILPDEEAGAVAKRRTDWGATYRPLTDEQTYHFEQVVVNSIRVERCQERERVIRTEHSLRALLNWDEDRRFAAETLAAGLSTSPSLITRQLSSNTQGCDWLLVRWNGLKQTLEQNVEWSDAQRSLAADLVGMPLEFRNLKPWTFAKYDSPLALAEAEIQRLERLQRTVLEPLDASERSAVEQGRPIETPKELRLLQRYESSCYRRFQEASKVVNACRTVSASAARPKPAPSPEFSFPEVPRTPTGAAPTRSRSRPAGGCSRIDIATGVPTRLAPFAAGRNEPIGDLGKILS